MGDLDVETSKNVCNSFGKSFGVGEDNKATMVDTIYFLLSTQLAAIVNEVSRVVVSGEGFRYWRVLKLSTDHWRGDKD